MDMTTWTASTWLAAFAAALCVGLSKTGFAGFGMATVVLMATILPPRESVGAVLPMLIFADVFAVLVFRKHAHWRHVGHLLPPALLGIVAGFLIMPFLDNDGFARVIGGIVLLMVVVQAVRGLRPNAGLPASVTAGQRATWFARVMGLLSGVTTMMANAAGPVMSLYLLACRMPKNEFVGTAAVFFLIINWVKVPFSVSLGLITPDSLRLNAILIPGILVGVAAGRLLLTWIPQRVFETLVLVFAAAASVKLLLA